MKKKICLLLSAAFVLSFIAGCQTAVMVNELPPAQQFKGNMSAEMKLCRKMVIAFVRNDAKTFTSQFTTSLKNFDASTFERTRKEVIRTMGEPISFQYITTLQFAAFKPHFWKIRFSRKDRNGKTVYAESLLRIVTGISPEKEIIILAFNFV